MPNAQFSKAFNFPGIGFGNASQAPVEFDNTIRFDIALPANVAAQSGTLDSRTDDDTGVAGLAAGHGIETGDVVDVYWSGGVRYGMDATVSGNDVTLDGGAGDVLPAVSTAVTVVEQVEINPLNLDGDAAKIVGVIYQNAADPAGVAHLDLQDSGNATIAEHDLVHEAKPAGLDAVTDIANGATNIYTGNPIVKGFASHKSLEAATLFVIAGLDSTP